MTLRNTDERYGVVAQVFHWTVAALIFIQLAVGMTASGMPLGIDRLIALSRHKSIGVTIFVLVILRLAWRLTNSVPKLPPQMPPLERRLAHLTHGLFYVLLLGMPIAGWLNSSASNLTVSWFGILLLPDLVGPDERLASVFARAHETMAWILLTLVCVHLLAALRHQLILRDGILWRMLPRFLRPPEPKDAS